MRIMLLLLSLWITRTNAFLPSSISLPYKIASRPSNSRGENSDCIVLWTSDSDSKDDGKNRLLEMGYSPEEIQRSARTNIDQIKVRVDLVDKIDPVTLTAVGFGLIALNFLVFANLGDGGIGALVATIINSF